MSHNLDLINKPKCYKMDVILAFEAKMSTELFVSNWPIVQFVFRPFNSVDVDLTLEYQGFLCIMDDWVIMVEPSMVLQCLDSKPHQLDPTRTIKFVPGSWIDGMLSQIKQYVDQMRAAQGGSDGLGMDSDFGTFAEAPWTGGPMGMFKRK